ncbi:hypothetical protein GWN42_31380 [candidate division KSB1 bacterium]|nr:hypothetical protein [Phycisphaerae bacterium]NIV97172.1 hypothetical protein [candidate division KSB1 bacterium]
MTTISEESAREQVAILLDFYDIDPEYLPSDQANIVNTCIRKLTKSIMTGRLEIAKNDNNRPEVTQLTNSGEEINYGVLSGKHREETSKVEKENNHYGKIYAMLGSMSGLGRSAISQLEGPDLTTAEALGLLFLQA